MKSSEEYLRRNRDMARRYQTGERIADLAREWGISHGRAMQILAVQLRKGEHWYDDKLPTMLRNCITQVMWDLERDIERDQRTNIWALSEREAAEIIVRLSQQRKLYGVPGLGQVSLWRLEEWLKSLGLKLK
jgi:uncharacterized protein YoaH (UPF0181 family)